MVNAGTVECVEWSTSVSGVLPTVGPGAFHTSLTVSGTPVASLAAMTA